MSNGRVALAEALQQLSWVCPTDIRPLHPSAGRQEGDRTRTPQAAGPRTHDDETRLPPSSSVLQVDNGHVVIGEAPHGLENATSAGIRERQAGGHAHVGGYLRRAARLRHGSERNLDPEGFEGA